MKQTKRLKETIRYCLNKLDLKINSLNTNLPVDIGKHIKYIGVKTMILTANNESELINTLVRLI